ncbi:MAG: hypothetical protein ACRENG_30140 [bacterium]
MRRNRTLVAMAILVIMVFFLGCSDDKNPVQADQFGEVSGTITFVGTWPSKGDIQVSMWTSWPPTGPPAAFTSPLTPGVLTQTYKISGLSKGPYSVITVGWRNPADPTGAKVIGVYSGNDILGVDCKGQFTVQTFPIEISDAKLKWSDVNIRANLDIANLGEISGKVTFVGTWPTAGDIQVSAWTSWPPTGPPAAASAAFNRDNNTQTYRIQCLAQKTYPVITVGWRDPANPAGARVLGIYWANSDSVGVTDGRGITPQGIQALPINITAGNLTWKNVNIKANLDFSK